MRRVIPALALALAVAAPAWADVTIVQTTSGKGGPMGLSGESVTYLKGHRMRTDMTVRGKKLSTIIDLEKRQFISLETDKREAEITDMAAIAQSLQAYKTSDIKATMTPTGNKKSILGYDAQEYDLRVVLPFQIPEEGRSGGDMQLAMSMGGPVWLAKDAPGHDEYMAFYMTMAERGLFFGDPRAAKAAPGQTRGMVEMYKRMSEAGMPLVSELQFKMEGGGPMGGLMSRMGGGSITSTVTKIATDAVDDALFEIPAGYKVKQNK